MGCFSCTHYTSHHSSHTESLCVCLFNIRSTYPSPEHGCGTVQTGNSCTLLHHLAGLNMITIPLCLECVLSLRRPLSLILAQETDGWTDKNRLSALPKDVVNLKKLKTLHLQNNQLTELPICVCHLVSLETLNIECNIIERIPIDVCQMSGLQELYAKSNCLENLPNSIAQLSNLEGLYLTDNRLKSIPNQLEGLSSLKQLHLANNKLRFLPHSLTKLTQLQGISLSGNDLKYPPLSACRGGVASLQTYMRSRSETYCSAVVTENPYYDDSGDETPYEDL